jgi:hypothetical protein
MHRNAIDCEVLTGTERNKRILIPRINLTYSGTILPFNFQRSQFPIIAAFAIINNSQKQTFEKIAILLKQSVFNCTSQQVAFDHHSTARFFCFNKKYRYKKYENVLFQFYII